MSAHPRGAAVFVCTGRPVDRDGQPHGQPCGRAITLARNSRWDVEGARAAERQLAQIARAAGWAISDRRTDGSRDAMCPRCRKPSAELTALIKELTR